MNATRTNVSQLCSIVGCLLVQLCVGIIYLWSIFKTPMAVSFGCSPDALGMVSSYMLSAFVVGCFLGGLLNDRKGPRLTCLLGVQLFSAGIVLSAWVSTPQGITLTYALMGGLGSGLSYSACVSCVQKWLPHRRGLATGLAVSAFGLSTVLFTPVSQAIMAAFRDEVTGVVEFGGVFSTLGLIFLSAGLVASNLISLPGPVVSTAETNLCGLKLGQCVRTLPFWCIFFTVFFINGTWNLAVPVLYDLGLERGLPPALATFAVSFTGVPNALGRLGMASLSDKIGRKNCIRLLSILTAGAALVMIFARSWGYITAVAVIAFAYGGPSSVNAAMTTDYFGAKYSGTNYGVIMLALGASSLCYNALATYVLQGSITLSFLCAALSALIPLALVAAMGQPALVTVVRDSQHPNNLPIQT